MSEIEFWRLDTVKQKTGLSKSEIYRRVAERLFPAPRKYPGTAKSLRLSTEVNQWQRDLLSLTAPASARSVT